MIPTSQTSDNPSNDKVQDRIDSSESVSQDEEKGVITTDGEYSVSSDSNGAHRGLSTKQKAAQDERATLAKQESQAISCLRWIVLLVLIIVGTTFAALVFHFVREEQLRQFAGDFRYYAEQVINRFNSQLKRTLDAQDTLSTDITSYALETGSVFPFVTLPDFEFKSANARITGDSTFILYLPCVKEDTKVQWETYAAAHSNHSATAYASEQTSKEEQDRSFGKETPEYEGSPLEFILLVENNPAFFVTSKIWPPRANATQVSWCFSHATFFPHCRCKSPDFLFFFFMSRILHTSRSGKRHQPYLPIFTIGSGADASTQWCRGYCSKHRRSRLRHTVRLETERRCRFQYR